MRKAAWRSSVSRWKKSAWAVECYEQKSTNRHTAKKTLKRSRGTKVRAPKASPVLKRARRGVGHRDFAEESLPGHFSCIVCDAQIPWAERTLLEEILLDDDIVQLIAEGHGRGGSPLLDRRCARLMQKAQAKANSSTLSKVAKYLISVAEAFMNRDWAVLQKFLADTHLMRLSPAQAAEHPRGADGRCHPHVFMQQTCRWEPFLGATADAARAAALRTQDRPEAMAARACMAYTTGRRTKALEQRVLEAEREGGDYHAILKANDVPKFAIPFYDLLVLSLPVGDRVHVLARTSLRENWTTSCGPGRLLNELLFQGKYVLPETRKDLNPETAKSELTSGKANAIFTALLVKSPFGCSILSTGGVDLPHFNDLACRTQRLCYKLCELRKATTQWRFLWRFPWNIKEARENFWSACSKVVPPMFAIR